jgi:hypothetical protein
MVKWSRTVNPAGSMAMGQYFAAIFNLRFRANDRQERMRLGKNRTVIEPLCSCAIVASRTHRSIDTVSGLYAIDE